MALEIQNISEESERMLEEIQNIVHKDELTIQELLRRGEDLELGSLQFSFIKKPRSNIHRYLAKKLQRLRRQKKRLWERIHHITTVLLPVKSRSEKNRKNLKKNS